MVLERIQDVDSKANSPDRLLEHLDWIRRLARQLVRDPGLAEDVSQETLAVAMERPRSRGGRSAGGSRRWRATSQSKLSAARRAAPRARSARRAGSRRPPPSTWSSAPRSSARSLGSCCSSRSPTGASYCCVSSRSSRRRRSPRSTACRCATVHTRLARALAQLRARLDTRYGARGTWAIVATGLLAAPASESQLSERRS